MTDLTMQQMRDRVFDSLHVRGNTMTPSDIVWTALVPLLNELADLRERVRLLELAREGPADITSPMPLKGPI